MYFLSRHLSSTLPVIELDLKFGKHLPLAFASYLNDEEEEEEATSCCWRTQAKLRNFRKNLQKRTRKRRTRRTRRAKDKKDKSEEGEDKKDKRNDKRRKQAWSLSKQTTTTNPVMVPSRDDNANFDSSTGDSKKKIKVW